MTWRRAVQEAAALRTVITGGRIIVAVALRLFSQAIKGGPCRMQDT